MITCCLSVSSTFVFSYLLIEIFEDRNIKEYDAKVCDVEKNLIDGHYFKEW